jgi:hypothetical protein
VDGQTSLKILAVVRSEIASLRMLFVKRVVKMVQIEKSAKTFSFTGFISNVAMRTKNLPKRPDCRSFFTMFDFWDSSNGSGFTQEDSGRSLCEARIHNSQFKVALKRFTATLRSN